MFKLDTKNGNTKLNTNTLYKKCFTSEPKYKQLKKRSEYERK